MGNFFCAFFKTGVHPAEMPKLFKCVAQICQWFGGIFVPCPCLGEVILQSHRSTTTKCSLDIPKRGENLFPPHALINEAQQSPQSSSLHFGREKSQLTFHFPHSAFFFFCLFFPPSLPPVVFPCSPLQPVVASQPTLTNVIFSDV